MTENQTGVQEAFGSRLRSLHARVRASVHNAKFAFPHYMLIWSTFFDNAIAS